MTTSNLSLTLEQLLVALASKTRFETDKGSLTIEDLASMTIELLEPIVVALKAAQPVYSYTAKLNASQRKAEQAFQIAESILLWKIQLRDAALEQASIRRQLTDLMEVDEAARQDALKQLSPAERQAQIAFLRSKLS